MQCVSNLDFSFMRSGDSHMGRERSLVFVALCLVLGAAGYVIASAGRAGVAEAVFLGGLALGGLGLLLARALAAPAAKAPSLGRSAALALLDGTRDAMALTGREGELTFANRAYRARFGTKPPAQALSTGERQSAEIFRLLRVALAAGRAEGLFAGDGVLAFPVSAEHIQEGQGRSGFVIWRIGPSDKPQGQLLLEGRTEAVVDAARAAVVSAPVAEGGRLLPVAARIVDDAPVGILLIDAEGRVSEANRTFTRLTGRATVEGLKLSDLVAETDRSELAAQLAALAGPKPASAASLELHFAAKEGTERSAQIYLTCLDGSPGKPLILGYLVDTTDQKNLELQFAQSQKMQAVGQLAGGIAHDFNNTLQAIIGFCELLLQLHPPGDPSFTDIDQIRQNATRAAGLTRQLLAFSRQQTLMPTVIWLPDAVAENRMLLKRLVGEKVELEIKHERDLWQVRVDETQLIQVLMNLAVNARDAMPDGGQLTIRTANVPRAQAMALGHEVIRQRPDDYVLIEVSDTGCGIPKELLGKIFEPFFTTKAVGQGTGLGLSTVYGIVKQTNGFVFADSEIGKGTVFRVYLPRHREDPKAAPVEEAAAERAQDHTGRGTILLVEDEDAVRSFAARALGTRGYSVLEAAGGEAALELLHGHAGKIDMLISDVMMPGINGPSLVKAVRAERPEIKIILISGYAEDTFRKELSREGQDLDFLPKPFTLKQLISKVKDVLAASPRPA
jgi:PAS domain S-box-containing protein